MNSVGCSQKPEFLSEALDIVSLRNVSLKTFSSYVRIQDKQFHTYEQISMMTNAAAAIPTGAFTGILTK